MLLIFHFTIFFLLPKHSLCVYSINQQLKPYEPSTIKSKCLEYIINSNVHASNLIVIWQNSQMIDHNIVQHIMRITNVLIINFTNATDETLTSRNS